MATLSLRDRDGIVTKEGLIFRVFGYSHPQSAFICDAEYASADVFKSTDPRAPRTGGGKVFYKFYNDDGWKLVFRKFPQYTVFHEILGQRVVGVNQADIAVTRKPEERLQALVKTEPKDELQNAMQRVLNTALHHSGLNVEDFGVFGSMLHGFYHPKFSDIDLIVYGRKENAKMRETLARILRRQTPGFQERI